MLLRLGSSEPIRRRLHPPTYPEVVVHVARENCSVVVWSLQLGRLLLHGLPKLLLEPLLVVDHNLPPFGLHQANERLDDLESSTSKWDQNQDLRKL